MEPVFRFIVMRMADGSHQAMCIDAGCGGIGMGILDAVLDLRVGLTSSWQWSQEDKVSMNCRPDPPLERVWLAVMSGDAPGAADLDECEIDQPVVGAGSFKIEDGKTGRMDVREIELAGV